MSSINFIFTNIHRIKKDVCIKFFNNKEFFQRHRETNAFVPCNCLYFNEMSKNILHVFPPRLCRSADFLYSHSLFLSGSTHHMFFYAFGLMPKMCDPHFTLFLFSRIYFEERENFRMENLNLKVQQF